MRFLVLSLTIFFFHTAHSQEFEVKKVSTANFKEFYTVNKISKLESGTYLKLDKQNKDTLISGIYLNGVKSGIWRYFSKRNNLWMSYNFDRKAFEKLPEAISRIDSFVVKKADSFTYEKVDLPPVYIGFKNEVERILIANFNIPKIIMEKHLSGISIATFVVDKNGKIKEFQGEQVLSSEVFPQMEKALKLVDGDWSPAIVNGEPVDSQIVMVYDITPQGAKYLFQDNPKAIVVHFQYSGVTQTKRTLGYVTRTVPMDDIDFSKMRSMSKRFSR